MGGIERDFKFGVEPSGHLRRHSDSWIGEDTIFGCAKPEEGGIMAFELSGVVPWGRSYAEYVAMFALSDEDLNRRILGCGDGPAAFNAGLTGRGGSVVSVDPLYAFSADAGS